MSAIDDLNLAVTAIDSVIVAALVDLEALEAEVKGLHAAGVDPAALEPISTKLNNLAASLELVTATPPAP